MDEHRERIQSKKQSAISATQPIGREDIAQHIVHISELIYNQQPAYLLIENRLCAAPERYAGTHSKIFIKGSDLNVSYRFD